MVLSNVICSNIEWQGKLCGRPGAAKQARGQTNPPVPRFQGYCFTDTNRLQVLQGVRLYAWLLANTTGRRIYGEDHAQLLLRIRMVFQRCSEWGITLSKKKYQFGPVVQFAGYIVSEEGTRMNPDLVAAIAKFPAPKDITNLRSLIGLVNRFNVRNPDLKQAMVSWQGLLKKCNKYKWGDVYEAAQTKLKETITNPEGPILRHFNSRLPIQLLTDASRSGIEFCLVQTEVTRCHCSSWQDHNSSAQPKIK